MLRPQSVIDDEKMAKSFSIQLEDLDVFKLGSWDIQNVLQHCVSAAKGLRQKRLADDGDTKEVLLALRPSGELLVRKNRLLDAQDFSNLACERCVDGYSIDVSCVMFLNKNMQSHG